MKLILLFIRIIFLPIKLINILIYGSKPPSIIAGYSWYTKSNYNKMLENSKDDEECLIHSFEDWKKSAEERIDEMEKEGVIVFRVKMNYNQMSAWFIENGLENTTKNRMTYVNHQLQSFLERPII